ncbi:hypothetical protein AAGS20_000399 [Yersinia enterocolitica]|nr:hypothetical protein [Yersinia enterocolitica]HEI6939026.1 hypothetical protein [Yersinia enterocolitica]
MVKRSWVKEAWNASGGYAGARSVASIVTNGLGIKVGRWLAGKLMKELNIASCQMPAHKYKRGGSEHVEIPNLLGPAVRCYKAGLGLVRRCDLYLDG